LFPGSEDSTYKSADIPVISIWEIGKGVTIYKRHAVAHCYRSGILWYAQGPGKPQERLQMRGPLGHEQPYDKPPGKFVYFDYQLNCAYVDTQSMRERGRAGGPLLLNHGYLDLGSNAPSDVLKNKPVTFYRPGHTDGLLLPFKSREFKPPTYIPFKNAYFIVSDYFDKTRGIGVAPWPTALPQPLWWLTPNGEVTQVTIPPNAFGRGSAGHYLPTVKGIFVTASGLVSETDSGEMGGYLIQGNNVEKVITGIVEGIAISPDGCKVAFAHAPNIAENLANPKNRRTLKMIDFCK
jgi:hypothetical protein